MLVGILALQHAALRLGLREDEGKKNQGQVVIDTCRRWVDEAWWRRHYPVGDVAWCAGFVSTCIAEALPPGPQLEHWLRVGSLSCDVLWARARTRGWTLVAPHGRGDHAIYGPGDLVFWGKPGDLSHVGLVEHVSAGELRTIEGNSSPDGQPPHTQVVRRRRPLADLRLFGRARIPWEVS